MYFRKKTSGGRAHQYIRGGAAQRGEPRIAQCVAAQGAARVERRAAVLRALARRTRRGAAGCDRPASRRGEVAIAGATVLVPMGVDAATLERVLAAVRCNRPAWAAGGSARGGGQRFSRGGNSRWILISPTRLSRPKSVKARTPSSSIAT